MAERSVFMSKIKTKKHPYFYEGFYWSSRCVYAAWVKLQRNVVIF